MSHLSIVGPCEKCGVRVDQDHDHKAGCEDGMLDMALDQLLKGHTVQLGDPSDGRDKVLIEPR